MEESVNVKLLCNFRLCLQPQLCTVESETVESAVFRLPQKLLFGVLGKVVEPTSRLGRVAFVVKRLLLNAFFRPVQQLRPWARRVANSRRSLRP